MIKGIIYITTLALFACSRGGDVATEHPDHIVNHHDSTNPVIQINTPSAKEVFANGTVITISGNVKDEALYNGKIKITNENNFLIKEQAYEVHGLKSFDFTVTHLVSVTVASDYTITVEFQDHGLNKTTKSVKVRVRP